ncbi:MAG: UGSC family (seleno)protein, partial [Burkholderiales bacterium]
MDRIEVVSPLGGEASEQKSIAPRLSDLNGKTVAEIWNGVFKGDETFPAIRRALLQRYPGIRLVPFTEFPHFYGGDNPTQQRALARQLASLVKEKGCDAVISGNG